MNSSAQEKVHKRVEPKEDVRVKREYDEKGNLIKFDSVYTYSWSGDTTLMKSFSPPDFPNPSGNHFGFFSDSTFWGNSFFDDFDGSFFNPFSQKQDSLLRKEFGLSQHYLNNFGLKNDSLALDLKGFDDFFDRFNENKSDSISSGLHGKILQKTHPKSMDEMMKMLQQQMQEMEKKQREFLKEQPKWRKF